MEFDRSVLASRRAFLGLTAGFLTSASISPAASAQPLVKTKARIVIIGAGAAGTAIANRLAQRLTQATIVVIDGRREHVYQPGLSLVAAGLRPASYVLSRTSDWLLPGVALIEEPVLAIDPVAKTVATAGLSTIRYDYLIVAPGLVLDHQAIEGFTLDLVGSNGIGALYAGPEYAARTWAAASRFAEKGGMGLFTRPATEMKCAGAPLKHTFLIDDIASRAVGQGRYKITYAASADNLFSVPIVSEKVRMLFEQRGIQPAYSHVLKAIDPGRKIATFATPLGNQDIAYDYLHVIPPQRAPAVIRQSGLSWTDKWTDQGWVEVDQHTLRHRRFPEVFALGDVAGVPKGKTAASVKWQVPVVEDHLIAAIQGKEGSETFSGYTSCPLMTRVGRAMMIEFDYRNNLSPSFPGLIAPLEELWISWLMKEVALRATYYAMLRGKA